MSITLNMLMLAFCVAETLPAEENSTSKEHRFPEDSMDSALNSVNPSNPTCRNSTEYRTSGNAAYYRSSHQPATATSNSAPVLRRLSLSSAGSSGYYEVSRNRIQRRIEGTLLDRTFQNMELLPLTQKVMNKEVLCHRKACIWSEMCCCQACQAC